MQDTDELVGICRDVWPTSVIDSCTRKMHRQTFSVQRQGLDFNNSPQVICCLYPDTSYHDGSQFFIDLDSRGSRVSSTVTAFNVSGFFSGFSSLHLALIAGAGVLLCQGLQLVFEVASAGLSDPSKLFNSESYLRIPRGVSHDSRKLLSNQCILLHFLDPRDWSIA
ncbi:hypothetical protein NEOLEDRAFT_1127790 [Neolentinus lepideus HHB14362 ss-1]|uniref:Uncharacterized protein n=1 Tax=Neolentinus lepideus HHB14362 ss-1 TaxID=1314782 RepID=A0A165VMH4_9AGAM|nr:hypothetical protein NEOLEDRAFT_1127790 [Neolentinus lepideus HHB14362 ss-1]